jgi:monothiol glutaredoxin
VSRAVFPESHVHPAVREKLAGHNRAIVDEVQSAVAAHDVVVVGMGLNPFPKRACKALTAASVTFHYLGYGSYFADWRRRTALKMWTGWPTFPMIFVKGTFIGGATDLEALIASGELKKLLAGPRAG